MSTPDIELAFARALADAGLAPRNDETIPADGKRHRFRVTADRPGQRAGWAILHADGTPRGIAGDWRSGERLDWSPDGANLTAAERRESTAARRRRDRERDATAASAARRAVDLLERLPLAPADHPYLARKRVPPGPCRVTVSGALALAVRDASTGKVVSLQFIRRDADGSKRFLVGGRTAGGCLALGDLEVDGPVVIAEGFATASSIREATGWPVVVAFSAGNLKAVAEAMRAKFPEREIIVAGDNDAEVPGNPGVAKATEAARTARARLAVPPKAGDFNDLARADGPAAVAAIIEAAAEPEPALEAEADPLANLVQRATDDPGAPFEPAALEVLARLRNTNPAAWQRLRRDLKGVKVRVSDLDRALDRLDGGTGANRDERTGRPLKLKEIEPCHAEVDGIALLDELSRRFREYVIMSQAAADAVTLWAVHTHALDACHYTARLFVTSPDKRCGKSRLLQAIGKTVARPLLAGNISTASIYRTVQAVHPTLLVDEFDAHKKDDDELRGVINNGYERDNPNIRCDPNTLEPLEFDTFAACAIASIGRIWPTVEDRSIIIRLHRKRPSERVRKFRRNHAPELDRLASMAKRWALDHIDSIEAANPRTPEALSDRAADIWEPLLAIADLSGGDWPARARHAALALSADGVVEDESIGVMLLADLRGFLKERTDAAFATKSIIEYLATLEERPWPVYGRARKPINPKQLADILKPFEVRSNTIRIGGDTPKGYHRKDIERAAARYLTDSPATPPQPAETLGKTPNSAATSGADVADENEQKPKESATCGAVAARKGGKGREGGMEGDSAPEDDELMEWTG